MEPSKTKPISVLVVVINYFSHELVKSLLNGLALQECEHQLKLDIVCADNSATAEEHDALHKIQADSPLDFELLLQPYNIGFGRAVNVATQGRQFDFLWLLNPDIDLFTDTLDELIKPILELKSGIIGGLTITKNRKSDYRHAWQEPNLFNTFGWAFGIKKISSNPLWHDTYKHSKLDKSDPYKVDNISGCCMLISHNAWHSTEGFDEDFFLYSEEIDLCQRARSLGHQPFVAPKARLRHSAHSTVAGLARVPLIYSSKLMYADKHKSLPYRISYRIIIALGALLRSMAGLLRGETNRVLVWWNVAVKASSFKRSRVEERIQ